MTPPGAGPDPRWRTALVLALLVVPYVVGLGSPPLWDANEPLYAQPPREVLEWPEGDFLAPTWNGETYYAHPPFATWVTVPFYALLGASEASGRLAMALGAALAILATFVLGRRLAGPRAGLVAAAILAATPRFWLFSRQLAGDVWLVAFLTWGFALALPAFLPGDLDDGERRRRFRHGNVLIGLGFLVKGPVIAVLYAGALGLTWLVTGRQVPLAVLRPLRATLLIVLVGAPWSVYMALTDPAFLRLHYGWFHGARVAGGKLGDRGPLFYPVVLLGDAQPWLLAVPFALRRAWPRLRHDVRVAFPWIACLWIVAFFTLPAGKRNVYLLPLYPLLAVGLAPLALAVWDGAHRRALVAVGIVTALAAGVAAWMLLRLERHAPLLAPEVGVLAWALVALGLAVLAIAWRGRGRAVAAALVAAPLLLQTAAALALPALGRYRPVPAFAAEITRRQDPDAPEPAIIYAVSIHSLNFYLGRRTAVASDGADIRRHMGNAPRAFVLTPARYVDPVALYAPDDEKAERHALRHLARQVPGLAVTVLDRRPELAFKFSHTVLGHGPTTEDLVLVSVAPAEGAGTGGR